MLESSRSPRSTSLKQLGHRRRAKAGYRGPTFGAGSYLPPRSGCSRFHTREVRTPVRVLPSTRDIRVLVALAFLCCKTQAYLSVFIRGTTCPLGLLSTGASVTDSQQSRGLEVLNQQEASDALRSCCGAGLAAVWRGKGLQRPRWNMMPDSHK